METTVEILVLSLVITEEMDFTLVPFVFSVALIMHSYIANTSKEMWLLITWQYLFYTVPMWYFGLIHKVGPIEIIMYLGCIAATVIMECENKIAVLSGFRFQT